MKHFLFAILVLLLVRSSFAQTVLYSEKFNSLNLKDSTNAGVTTQYTTVPNSYWLINDTLENNPGDLSNPNKPFNVISPAYTGWAVVYNDVDKDTFLVSTSWTSTTGIAVDRWVITPSVSIQNVSKTVLTWLAKSPDASYPDGYQVYGTTNVNASLAGDFTNSPALYTLADGNTSGGGEKNEWTRRSVYLGSLISSSVTALRFAFRNNSKDMYQLWVDDVQVIELPYQRDAVLTKIETEKYISPGTGNNFRLHLQNNAAATINSIVVGYRYYDSNTNTVSQDAFWNYNSATGINYLQSDTTSFSLPLNTLSSAGLYTFKFWISTVNGASDENHNNDTAYFYLTVQNTMPKKRVMMEQFTSAMDGQNIIAQERANSLLSDSVVIVNIHTQDSLQETNSTSFINEYGKFTSFALFDRYFFPDLNSAAVVNNDYADYFAKRKNALSPASIKISDKTYNSITRQLDFTVTVTFVASVQGDYRINAYLLENNVYGKEGDTTLNGYNQVNDFYNVSWYGPYYHWGYYVPTANEYILSAWQYKHQNVLLHAFDGYYGSVGTIPTTSIAEGQSFQQAFSYTIPVLTNTHVGQMWNDANMYLVAFVDEYDADKSNRRILNCIKTKVDTTVEFVGISKHALNSEISVYPNPSSGLIYFNTTENISDAKIQVYDFSGKCLTTRRLNSSESLDLSEFPDGIYFIKINSSKGFFTKKIIIRKN